MTLTTSEKYKRERDKERENKSSSSTFAHFHYSHTFIATSIMILTGYHYIWLSEEMLMMGYRESVQADVNRLSPPLLCSLLPISICTLLPPQSLYSALNQMCTQKFLVKK